MVGASGSRAPTRFACRLLGWLITRSTRSTKFRLTIESISLSGIAGIRLQLRQVRLQPCRRQVLRGAAREACGQGRPAGRPLASHQPRRPACDFLSCLSLLQGPVREVAVERLHLGRGGGAAQEGGFLQGLLGGTLRLPIHLEGVAVQLRGPGAPSSLTSKNEDSGGGGSGNAAGEGVRQVAAQEQAAAPLQPAPLAEPQQQRGRLKLPLGLLQLVSVTVDKVQVYAEVGAGTRRCNETACCSGCWDAGMQQTACCKGVQCTAGWACV